MYLSVTACQEGAFLNFRFVKRDYMHLDNKFTYVKFKLSNARFFSHRNILRLFCPCGYHRNCIHLWPVHVMRLEKAQASPRALIPVLIFAGVCACQLESLRVHSCGRVCVGAYPSPGCNTRWTISDHALVSVSIHIGCWLPEGCWSPLTDIKGRKSASSSTI